MAPSLCENCNQRPKFGTHKFCGKTCAAQAAAAAKPKSSWGLPGWGMLSQPQGKAGPATAGHQNAPPAPQKGGQQLCIHCGKKPKFNNHDYCGKACAAQAGATQAKPSTAQRAPANPPKPAYSSYPAAPRAPAPPPPKPYKAPPAAVPATQGGFPDDDELEDEEGDADFDLDAYPPDSEPESEDGAGVLAATAPQPSAKSAPKGAKVGGAAQKIAPGICAIPACGQPSHVDKLGVKTKYCSIKHREDAVKLGLEEACIMCHRFPQSNSDYFCSSACRTQAMTKT